MVDSVESKIVETAKSQDESTIAWIGEIGRFEIG